MYSISACQTATERILFETISEELYATETGFIPSAPGAISKFLDPRGHFSRFHGEIRGFLLHKSGRCIGRAAAIINHSHNHYHGDRTGFFGFLDTADDPVAVPLLMQRVEQELRACGMDCARGPYHPHVHEACGLLEDHFEEPPFVGMPWNPPWLSRKLLSAGYEPVRTLHALRLDLSLDPPERVVKICRRLEARTGLRLRSLNMRKLDEELQILVQLYNRTLDRNWGFVPIHLADLRAAASELRAIADPEGIQIAEIHGRPAGFSLCLPNIHELLAQTRNTPRALRLLHLAWLLQSQRPTKTRLAVLGVLPEFRDRGISAWFFLKAMEWAKKNFREAEISWVEDNNQEILENSKMMGCRPSKIYRIYEKSLP